LTFIILTLFILTFEPTVAE